MNLQRAKEIAESGELANILFNGRRIYIQHVDEAKGTARIYPLDDPENEQEVPVEQLSEN
ncbi:small acid-soluble spore protein H [Ureibacillus sp. FSL K6-8385]|uniref:Small acid-soluble spore protein H n=1 Tax=Ureibacillus terrenus TaxID=118246 RepID=A0A540V1S2_9BACL|nr:small acid-soluble spore protein H [Ureibacillus terrenus]MED3662043.1 small acid-soluble spore protein H [Ureibacillus terrenus]MED3764678.1 small acid-soluble spore protein H [Ureibacillus terrenus]TQE90668.1 small acid-soluble spore protein H [Ureibacillus terrenus]